MPEDTFDKLISPIHRVERAAGEFRRGTPVLIRTNTGSASLASAAETLTQPVLDQMQNVAGAVALMITPDRAATLKIPQYTEPVLALTIRPQSAAEELRAVADPANDLNYPLKGPFQARRTEPDISAIAAVRLAKLAGVLPAAVWGEIPLKCAASLIETGAITAVNAEDILAFDDTTATVLRLIVRARVPLKDAEQTEIAVFRPEDGGPEHYAILIGDKASPALAPPGPVLTRLHSECFTGDLLGSLKCDCGDQLRGAIDTIAQNGGGVVLYLAQEGRGIGLMNKLRAYRLQDEGYDTLEANRRLGFGEDERLYVIAAKMLQILGYDKVRLLTNNPAKIAALEAAGIEVVARVPHHFPDNLHNRDYLRTKLVRAGHLP